VIRTVKAARTRTRRTSPRDTAAWCTGCEEVWYGPMALAHGITQAARRHVRSTGHVVEVERTVQITVGPR
jgi:hypothetical protein